MDSSGFDQMAVWWDEKLGDERDLWHRALIDPPLLRLVGEVHGLRLLDLACGNGYLSRRFARQGAVVTAVDTNTPLIERIRLREAQESLALPTMSLTRLIWRCWKMGCSMWLFAIWR